MGLYPAQSGSAVAGHARISITIIYADASGPEEAALARRFDPNKQHGGPLQPCGRTKPVKASHEDGQTRDWPEATRSGASTLHFEPASFFAV